MTKENQLFSKKCLQDGDPLVAVERIKIKHKLFRVIAYKLATGETAITTRQMSVCVKKPSYTARQFIRKIGVKPIQVQMPNRSVTDMIDIGIVKAFWQSLNESGEGNPLTKIGQKYLDEYLAQR
ncbi:MAG: hypothetical protein ACFB02_07950 [Mastigocoleus sp.]